MAINVSEFVWKRLGAARVSSGLHGDGVYARAIGRSDTWIVPFWLVKLNC
jgi:hypothetical protein